MMIAISVVVFVFGMSGPVRGGEQISLTGLPAEVQAAIQREQAAGSEIKNVAAEKNNGKTVYEIETMVRGHSRDLIIDVNGKVLEVEEEVSIDSVPAKVKAALEAHGKVTKLEMVTRGASVTYEAQVEKNGKQSEVVVNSSGARVKG